MDSEQSAGGRFRSGPGPFVAGVLLRALVLGVLAYVVVELLTRTNFYATTLVVLIVAALLVADLARVVTRADRSVERFLEALSAGALETPSRTAGLGRLAAPFENAVALLQATRRGHQQGNEYLQTLLDTVPAALVVIQPDGEMHPVNRAAARLTGAPPGTLLRVLGSTATADLVRLAPGTHQILRLAGGQQVLASAAQFMLPGSSAQRLFSLQRVAGELDAVELKAWDDMVRVLAHEMMNSLTPIASLSESLDGLLRAEGRTEEVAGALEAIRRRSQGLMRFVERYRRVAELPQATLQVVRLSDLLAGIEQLLRSTFDGKRIEFASDIAPPGLAARIDPDLLEQALINLLRNAADAVADEAQPRIRIACREEEGRVSIAVIDNGRGLTEAERDQIFVPFFTTKPGGSGVGLSLARRIALGHGGRLTVQPHEPRGAVFTLSLPR